MVENGEAKVERLRRVRDELLTQQGKLVDALDAERGRIVGLATSAAFIVGIFVAFRPERDSALITSLYAAGLVPFIALMAGLALYGIAGVRISGTDVRAWRLKRDHISARAQDLYVPTRLANAGLENECEWLMREISRLEGDQWPGVPVLVRLLITRRRVFDLASGVLALEVGWLVTVALIAPFI